MDQNEDNRVGESCANGHVFLRSVGIRNYKSIGRCNVALGPITVLLGRNGAGKSNFLDALRFTVDALQTSLDQAIKSRGGIDSVRRRSTGHPRNFAFRFDLSLPEFRTASFGFEIAARAKAGFAVKQERLDVFDAAGQVCAYYRVEAGELVSASEATMPPTANDRLYLVTASGLPAFRSTYDALLSMGFYNLNPESIKEFQSPDAGELLHRDGSNIASVISRLAADNPEAMVRVKKYLSKIVPGIGEVERVALGPKETLQFRQVVKGSTHPWKFYASSMSDGTLRALGSLVAVGQLGSRRDPVRLVGIEEPETALHPAAAGALMDALKEGSRHTQVILTTHSPDLLDRVDLDAHRALVVVSLQGTTWLTAIDQASRDMLKKHLYTAGELQRMDQLEPDLDDIRRQEQMRLFDDLEIED